LKQKESERIKTEEALEENDWMRTMLFLVTGCFCWESLFGFGNQPMEIKNEIYLPMKYIFK
jgi:hypothetical protein